MSTLYLPPERPGAEWFRDHEGIWSVVKHRDEVRTYSIDWTDVLDSGETVSGVTYADSGVTSSGASLSTPVSTITITGVGALKVTATTSASRTLIRWLRFYPSAEGKFINDYRVSM